jgi:hypothetical protein
MKNISQFFQIALPPHDPTLLLLIGVALLVVGFVVVALAARHYDSLEAHDH